jgi:hypothetical protein
LENYLIYKNGKSRQENGVAYPKCPGRAGNLEKGRTDGTPEVLETYSVSSGVTFWQWPKESKEGEK